MNLCVKLSGLYLTNFKPYLGKNVNIFLLKYVDFLILGAYN